MRSMRGASSMLLTDARTLAPEDIAGEVAAGRLERAGAWTREQFSRETAPLTPTLFRLCLALSHSREEAEDLLQNAMVKAFVHRASYRGDAPLLSWLYGIVRNERAESARMAARRRGLLSDAIERFGVLFDDLTSGDMPSPETFAIRGEDADALLAQLRELPEPYREVVWMCDIEELAYEAVADALSIPIGTVKSRHARGRARLRSLVDAASGEASR